MMDNNKTVEAKDSIFNKCFLKINRSSGNITIKGDPIPAYSYDELQILKNLLTKVLGEVNEYI